MKNQIMNNYIIEETQKTPAIKGDIEKGKLEIVGKSFPEFAKEFFEPFQQWLNEFYTKSPDSVEITIDLEYYNTSSSNFLHNIMVSLRDLSLKKTVSVIWKYEEDDIDMEETGLAYKKMLGDSLALFEKKEVSSN